jgi:hypothetical protein
VDRDGEVAATMFLRRGVSGAAEIDVHVLELTAGGWRLLGGGSGPGDDATDRRPLIAQLGGPALSPGGGGVARSRPTRLGFRKDEWISYAQLRVAQEVAVLRVGDRSLPVAGHGCAVVVWVRQPPRIVALDDAGAVLGPVVVRP